jgi:protease I
MAAKLSGKRVLLVIAPEQFRDEELMEPKEVFLNEGAEVSIAACRIAEAKGMLGATAKPDLLLTDVKPEIYDACVVVGGMGSPTFLWDDKTLHAILQSMAKHQKVTAGICLSGAVLAKAGVLNGKKATVWAMPESLAALKEGGANYVKEPVVRDGLVVTGEGPEAAGKFAQTVVEAIASVPARA